MVNYSISNHTDSTNDHIGGGSRPTFPKPTQNMSGGFSYTFPEAGQTTNSTSAELRWCDWIALSLANGKHIPPFNPFAPVEKRNDAIEAAKKILR